MPSMRVLCWWLSQAWIGGAYSFVGRWNKAERFVRIKDSTKRYFLTSYKSCAHPTSPNDLRTLHCPRYYYKTMPLTGAKGHEDPEMVVAGKENVRASLFVLSPYHRLVPSLMIFYHLLLFINPNNITHNKRINHPLTTITNHWPRVKSQ